MVNPVNAGHPQHLYIKAASGGVKRGEIVEFASNHCSPIAAEYASTAVLGIAMNDAVEDAVVDIYPLTGTLIEIDYYSGATAQSLTDANLGDDFDINVTSNDFTLDLDDTSGSFIVVAYNNDSKKAICAIPASFLYLNV